jgi:serine/threonine protein kinase
MSSDPAHSIPAEASAPPVLAEVPSPTPPALGASTPTTSPEVAPHARRMLDRYEIIAEIAKGGMGTVYLARLEGAGGFERLMAIKLMHEHLAEEEQFVTMLLDEARTAASIHHPNAVGIVDVCASPVGYYLVMNYVDGFSLWQVMTHPALDDRTRIRLSTRLIADALHGLHAAHTSKNAKGERLGIVHRDVSPQNVIVGTDGMGRIVDFGIALAASRVATSRPGMLKGKPSYMAPEQARGDLCDGRTDVFAMGIVFWESLMNERLFWAEMDVAVLMQVMDCIVERPDLRRPNVPAALADVAMKALAKNPADRYATARDFAVALERAAESSGLLATTHEVEERVAQLFADELAEKQRAVAGHLSASSGTPVLLQKGQLGTIPKLLTKKPTARDLPTRTSGVRARSGEVALAKTSHATPVPPAMAESGRTRVVVEPSATPAPLAPATTTPASNGTGKLGVALGAVGVLLALAAAGVYFSQSAEAPTTPTPTTSATSPVAPPVEPTIPPAAQVDPPAHAELAEEPPAATTVETPAAPPLAEPAAAPPTTPPTAGTVRRGSRVSMDTTPTAAPPQEGTPHETSSTHPTTMASPELESNPYLTH